MFKSYFIFDKEVNIFDKEENIFEIEKHINVFEKRKDIFGKEIQEQLYIEEPNYYEKADVSDKEEVERGVFVLNLMGEDE